MYIQVGIGTKRSLVILIVNNVSDFVIFHNSLVSLHVQVHNQLRQFILSGQWPYGSRLPSESDFVEYLRVSRTTIRLALQQVEVEGLIERIAGRGAFVIYQADKEHINRVIAFVTSDFDSENQLLALSGIESAAKLRGYQVVFTKARSREEEVDILNSMQEKDSGVVLWSNGSDISRIDKATYQRFRMRIVLLDRTIDGFECDCVTSDNYGGATALLQHMVELGHQHIVFLSHPMVLLSTVKDRYRAYQDVLQANGLTLSEPWVIGPPGKELSFRRALRASVDNHSLELQQIKEYMFSKQPRPTAIFAINDLMAVMTMRAMKLLSVMVPDMVSVAGFDDADLAAHLDVPLTTVAQDSYMLGKTAAQRLIDRIEGYSGPISNQIIPTQLRIRRSTALAVRM
jgi:DNA-binding LacI/PurR family transcriptional regulator